MTIVGVHAAISHGEMKPMMGLGILLTGVGIIMIASNTPHGPAHKPPASEASAAENPTGPAGKAPAAESPDDVG